MPSPLLFDEVVENAFDFLETAIGEFNHKPKYSVVHFSTAIELILKARLMHEHWSLIVDGKPDLNKFKEGNFKSINFKELIPRIEGVLNENIPEEAKKCFDAIANHRNKMVHFFHEANDATSEKIIKEIVIEQSSGWFFLRRILEKWSHIFSNYKDRIMALNFHMKGHQIYLLTVYEKLKPEIAQDKKKGAIYRVCSGCSFEASKENELTDKLVESKCRVCLLTEWIAKIDCPECKKNVGISQYNIQEAKCSCGGLIDQELLKEELDTDPATVDNYFEHPNINCAQCMTPDSVVAHHQYWVCTECLHVDNTMGICGWCNEGQIGGGDLEYSYHAGCEFCDGHAGWDKDKDD